MTALLANVDTILLGWAPPLLRILLWGAACAAVSMGLYARLSPQPVLQAIKTEQKALRRTLTRYDGEWGGLRQLMARDMQLSFRQIGLISLPFAASVAPVVGLMFFLPALYPDSYSTFGPDWMRGFEFWFFAALLAVSLAIKIRFKIA